jgi:hypothetical protein
LERGEDAYSLFVSRSAAMTWSSTSTSRAAAEPPALWGINEADLELGNRVDSGPTARFQVEVPLRPLPIHPLVACVGDTLSRIGRMDLGALQLQLPAYHSGSDLGSLVQGLNWFEICDPAERTIISITIGLGDGAGNHAAGLAILRRLQELNTGQFEFHSVTNHAAGVPAIPAALGAVSHADEGDRVTVTGTTPEWSFDALGWLMALVAETCRQVGSTKNPTLFTIRRR